MLPRKSLLPLALVLLGGARAASASTYDQGQWVTSFVAGSNLMTHGTFQNFGTGGALDLGALDPTFTGSSATTTINHLSTHDVFRDGLTLGLETGFMAQTDLEPFVRFQYSRMHGRTARVGTIESDALAAPAPVLDDFGDFNAWTLDLGSRYFFVDTGNVRAFIDGYVGVTRIDPLHGRLMIAGIPADMGREQVLPQETRLGAGLEGGVSWKIADATDLSLSVGAQYIDTRSRDTQMYVPLGLESGVKLSDQRWSVPLDLGLTYHF
jgi:hypothetical protein